MYNIQKNSVRETEPVAVAVFFSPSDNIGKFVVRAFKIVKDKTVPSQGAFAYDTLEETRKHIPTGWINQCPQKDDNYSCVEVWVPR